MDADYDQLLSELEGRIALLEELNRKRMQITASLKAENAALKTNLHNRENELTVLERKLSVSLIGQGVGSERESRLASLKSQIDALAREVDGCIALLEKKV